MGFHSYLSFLLIPVLLLVIIQASVTPTILVDDVASLNRSSFPARFIFGTASAAYQYEGAANEGGRGPSTWDTLTHKHPERIADRSNGDVAVDQYHRYKEDVGIMKYINMDAYRFSISWSRILPKGKISKGINQEGVMYYNNLINELLNNGLLPFVTIFHWDLPQALEDEYKGFLSPHVIKDFEEFAELCFKEFGDRVKHWITFNEPWSYSTSRSGEEVYLTSHYQLLAHAASVKIYKTQFQASQKGLIGITLNTGWFLPYSNTKLDNQAAQRATDFMFGWFMEPLTKGNYPKSMRRLVGSRLPRFTEEQSKLLIGSFDFIGINYYSSRYAAHTLHATNVPAKPTYQKDMHANLTSERNGILIGPKGASTWLYAYPRGIRDLLLYTKRKYNNPLIYITENGWDDFNDPKLPLEEALKDTYRINYFHSHLYYLLTAIKDGVKVKGYFAWSLLDNFEWESGFTVRFGLYFVDYKDNLKRHPKLSAHWFKNFLKK